MIRQLENMDLIWFLQENKKMVFWLKWAMCSLQNVAKQE